MSACRPISRRKLLSATGFALLCALETRWGSTSVLAPEAHLCLIDARLPEAARIARLTLTPGRQIQLLRGDAEHFWYRSLRRPTTRLAGVTRWSDFLVFQELARDDRLRVRSQTLHRILHQPLLVRWELSQ